MKRRAATSVAVPMSTGTVFRNIRTPAVNTRGDSVIVGNSEILFEVATAASGAFGTDLIALNMQNLNWLSGVAANYSKFRWRKLRLVYIPACSTSTSGSVTMGLQYQYTETAPTTIIQAAAYYRSVTSPVWAGYEGAPLLFDSQFKPPMAGAVALDVDVARFSQPWYPVSFATQSGVDADQFVPVSLVISSSGGPTSSTLVGYVHDVYLVELIEPVPSALNV